MSFFARLRRLLTPRFSLRTLLIMVTLAAVLLGWAMPRFRRVADIKRLRDLGFQVELADRAFALTPRNTPYEVQPTSFAAWCDQYLGDGFACSVYRYFLIRGFLGDGLTERERQELQQLMQRIPNACSFALRLRRPTDIAEWNTIRGNEQISEIHCEDLSLTPETGEFIRSFPKLTTLRLARFPIGGARLNDLGNASGIQKMVIESGSENLSPEDWRALGSLPNLQKLAIHGAEFTPEAIKAIGLCSSLVDLECDRSRFTAAENESAGRLKPWNRLQSLRRLSLKGCKLTDADIASLGVMPNMQELYFGGNRLTDKVLPELGNFQNVEVLELSHAELTDDGFEQSFPDFPNLLQVSLFEVPIGLRSLKKLEQQAPEMRSVDIGGTNISGKDAQAVKFECTLSNIAF